MSREPFASYVSARNLNLNLNSAAVAQQAELEGSGEASKSDGDSASRDDLGGGGREEERNVSDVERKKGKKERNGEGLNLDAKSAHFSEESWNKDEEAPNPIASIVDSTNDLEINVDMPKVEEADKNVSKYPPGNKSLVRKEIFTNDTDSEVLKKDVSSGEVEEAPNFEPEMGSLESDILGQYAGNKQLQSKEGQEPKPGFSVGDVVWGKVRSHPWWPGQIYHPSFASEMALKHQKNDHFLIAYFGDKTFAWNEESRLKPFESCFSQMEKQSSLEAFVDAVEKALEEVARRTVIGMTCGCIANELIADLKYQMVENAGLKEGTCFPTVDQCLIVSSFEPDRLLDHIHALSQLPYGNSDKLEFVKVKALLKAIFRSKGYPELPEICFGGGLSPNEEEVSAPEREAEVKDDVGYKNDGIPLNDTSSKEKRRGRGRPPGKKKLIEEEDRKQKSLPELMKKTADSSSLNSKEGKDGVKAASMSSSKKHMISGSDSVDCGKGKKKTLNSLGDIGSMSASSSRMRAVKIGQCISRVAKEMKFSYPVFVRNDTNFHNGKTKVNGRTSSVDGRSKTPRRDAALIQDYPTPSKMLSLLCLAAKDPTKTNRFQSMVVGFFVNWRDSHATDSLEDENLLDLVESKKDREKVESDLVPVEVKSDYFQDSYWSDVMFEKNPKKDGPSRGTKRKAKSKMKHTKKTKAADILSFYGMESTLNISEHVSDDSAILSDNQQHEERLVNLSDDKTVEECNPAALILRFSDHNALPSESDLIMVFSQYGPLKEAETEVSRKRRCASVMFKRGIDAEVAFSSAGKFSAFGPALVSYRLRYSTSSSPGATSKKDPSPTVGETSVLLDSGVVPTDEKA